VHQGQQITQAKAQVTLVLLTDNIAITKSRFLYKHVFCQEVFVAFEIIFKPKASIMSCYIQPVGM